MRIEPLPELVQDQTKPQLPNTTAALELVGLGQNQKKSQDLQTTLNRHSLDTESLVSALSDIAHNGESDHLRLRAIETGLKMSGALKENEKPIIPSFTIIINDPNSQFAGVNPILIPR